MNTNDETAKVRIDCALNFSLEKNNIAVAGNISRVVIWFEKPNARIRATSIQFLVELAVFPLVAKNVLIRKYTTILINAICSEYTSVPVL